MFRFLVRSVLAVLLGLGYSHSALGCIWTYGTNLHGRKFEVNELSPEAFIEHLTTPHEDRSYWEKQKIELEALLKTTDDFKPQNDYAAALMYLGEAPKAVKILEQLEVKHPGDYVIATNLGTAYELAGDNEKALHWIREGVLRNPNSHYGSEWVHVKVLEAKHALARDPDWLRTHTVLGLDFGSADVPQKPAHGIKDTSGQTKKLDELSHDVEYQLHERLQFTPSKDPIVADLLFDLANLVAVTKAVEYAGPVYELALNYGPTNPELVERRRNAMAALIAENPLSGAPSRDWVPMLVDGGAIIVPAFGLCVLIWLIAVHLRRRARTD